jgi:uncharacterized cupin superfamily protein
MSTPEDCPVLNIDDAPEQRYGDDPHWGGPFQVLTPFMQAKGRDLGVNLSRLAPGHVGCPFHAHQLEDEVFYIISGTGILRYGEAVYPLRAGDCISCPAGTGVAHQIANTGTEELVYLGIGRNDPNEVCTYPDSGKVMVRALKTVGRLARTEYMDGEAAVPAILSMTPT